MTTSSQKTHLLSLSNMSKIVVADYDYKGDGTSQLSFNKGDRIVVLEEDDTGWWAGRLEKNGIQGYFPATFVKSITGEQQTEEPKEPQQLQDIPLDDTSLKVNEPNVMSKLQSVSKDTNALEPGATASNDAYEMAKTQSTSDQETAKQTENKTAKADIDYNNYFANAQKVVSIADNFDGDADAAAENYYSAEVLNLKFNPNAKTRYGLASHYMSMFASISTIILGTSCFVWSNGSDWLEQQNLVNYNVCAGIGLYAFFGGIIILLWEYIRGDIRSKRCIPWRSILYFVFGFPLFFTLPTALCGILWMNCAIFSMLAFVNGESYERKTKKSYSDEAVLSPKERIMSCFNMERIKKDIQLKLISIRQQSQIRKYLFLILYLLGNLIYIVYWAVFYSNMVSAINEAANNAESFGVFAVADLALISNRNTKPGESALILTGWFPVAKMFGNLLDINCAFILLPVCRSFLSQLYNISTDQRNIAKTCSFLLSFMPLDKALQFHKLCSFLIVIGTILHTWAHFNHFGLVPSTYEEVYGATVWISGCIIIICMHFIFCTSFAAVRHGKFELFWYMHHLFIIFFLAIIFHGAKSWNPNFWKWFILPGILYAIERTIRELRARQAVGVVSVVHMNGGAKNARIFCLELEKTGPIKDHQEGQYIFIKAPIITKLQWHPFTISSPPGQKTATVHIRNMGDGSWTDRLQQFFQAIAPGKSYCELHHHDGDKLVPKTIGPDGNNLICIDGPMAAPTQHLGKYSTSIIIGAGIGVTPVRASLQSIVHHRFKKGVGATFPDHSYCVWIVNYNQLNAYRFMCRTLKEAEDELYDLNKKNEKQMKDKLLQMHIFVTSAPQNVDNVDIQQELKIASSDNEEEKDIAIWGTHYDERQYDDRDSTIRYTAPFSEIDIWRCLKQPSTQATQIGHIIIHKGRPKWDEFFEPIQTAHRGNVIGVMFCGPSIIAKDLKRVCGEFTDFQTKTIFKLHKENF